MLVVDNVSMSFNKRKILDGIGYEIKERTINVITGKSGSGKSTLLGIMSGLLKPEKGHILFNGKDIYRMFDFQRSRFRNRKIGFVFQFFNLLPDFTAYQNIIFPAVINPFSRNIREEADRLVEYLGIGDIKGQYPQTLSGGELQRVAIARSIINRPKLLLADEPTGNLDEKTADQIIKLFQEIRESHGISMVIVTHDRRFNSIADAHYHLENGRLYAVDDKQSVENAVGKEKSARKGKKLK